MKHLVEWYWQRETQVLRKKNCPSALCPPKIPNGVVSDCSPLKVTCSLLDQYGAHFSHSVTALGLGKRRQCSYGLEGPWFKPRRVQDIFSAPDPSRLALRPTKPHVQWVRCVFPRGKVAGKWSWPPTIIQHRGCKRVELYFSLPSVIPWRFTGWPLPLRLANYLKRHVTYRNWN